MTNDTTPTRSKPKRVTIQVGPELRDRLKELAWKGRTSMIELIRCWVATAEAREAMPDDST